MTSALTWPRCLGLILLLTVDAMRPGLAMNDPTRPQLPASRSAAAQPAPALGGGQHAPVAAMAAPASAAAPAAPRLQSLHLPQQGPATALVDGQLLRVGDKLGPHTVTAIDAQGVSAQGPAGRQRWTLLGVEYLDPAQARRAAARQLAPADLATVPDAAPPALPPSARGAAPPAAAALERYREAAPASPAPAAGNWGGSALPPVKPTSRAPAAVPVQPPLQTTATRPGQPGTMDRAPAPQGRAPMWAERAQAQRLFALRQAALDPAVAAPAPVLASVPTPTPTLVGADASASTGASASAGTTNWADMIAPPERLARLVARRVAPDADLSRWQTLRQLPQLASTRLPHAQSRSLHAARQAPSVGPAVLRLAMMERPRQAATPADRAAVAAAEQALMALALEQLQPPAAAPAALIRTVATPAPSMLPTEPPPAAHQPALQLRMTLELHAVQPAPALQLAQVKESS